MSKENFGLEGTSAAELTAGGTDITFKGPFGPILEAKMRLLLVEGIAGACNKTEDEPETNEVSTGATIPVEGNRPMGLEAVIATDDKRLIPVPDNGLFAEDEDVGA